MHQKRYINVTAIILICILTLTLAFTLTGCSKKTDSSNQNDKFSYNVVENTEKLSDQEIQVANMTEILNMSRGYINAINSNNTDFMEAVLADNINNMSKSEFIKQYKKDTNRLVTKKYIKNIKIIKCTPTDATVNVSYEDKKMYDFVKCPEGSHIMTLQFICQNKNKWIITSTTIN